VKALTRLAPVIFVLLWSTGFVGAKYILPYSEPFVFLTIRYALAMTTLLIVARVMKEPLKISRAQVIQSIKVGVFLQVVYIGGVFYAISLGVSAGVTSVLVSIQPILVSVLAVKFLNEKLGTRKIFGLILGFTGLGIVSGVLALLGTTTGYLLQKKGGSDIPFLPGTAVQFATATVLFALASTLFEEWKITTSFQFFLALSWIVFALSIGSIFLLFYLLKNDSASSVSSLYYLVPPLTAIQAYLFFRERITWIGLLGMGLAAIGTLLVTSKKS
jgi:drug/metabolite transporter (DMT)-like permease